MHFASSGYASEVIVPLNGTLKQNDVWAKCPEGYWLTAFERSTFTESVDWLPQIDKIRCSRPFDFDVV